MDFTNDAIREALSTLTVPQLRKLAAQLVVPRRSTKPKPELVAAITTATIMFAKGDGRAVDKYLVNVFTLAGVELPDALAPVEEPEPEPDACGANDWCTLGRDHAGRCGDGWSPQQGEDSADDADDADIPRDAAAEGRVLSLGYHLSRADSDGTWSPYIDALNRHQARPSRNTKRKLRAARAKLPRQVRRFERRGHATPIAERNTRRAERKATRRMMRAEGGQGWGPTFNNDASLGEVSVPWGTPYHSMGPRSVPPFPVPLNATDDAARGLRGWYNPFAYVTPVTRPDLGRLTNAMSPAGRRALGIGTSR